MIDFIPENYEYLLDVFTVSIDEPTYLVNNSPPEFQQLPEPQILKNGEKIEYQLPATQDYENNTVYLEDWSLKADQDYNWISLENATSLSDVQLVF